MQTVVETPIFIRRAELTGDEIIGMGGVRKMRFAAKGKGKSGGVRVIYYYCAPNMPIYALLIYGKNERADLTAEQRKSVAAFAAAIKAERRRQ
ncbi:MAG: type II toxin-antitoxin system RelE/ParE family toxin [Gammaproteobacteria bacterium]